MIGADKRSDAGGVARERIESARFVFIQEAQGLQPLGYLRHNNRF
jgi:hypothetical protein